MGTELTAYDDDWPQALDIIPVQNNNAGKFQKLTNRRGMHDCMRTGFLGCRGN